MQAKNGGQRFGPYAGKWGTDRSGSYAEGLCSYAEGLGSYAEGLGSYSE